MGGPSLCDELDQSPNLCDGAVSNTSAKYQQRCCLQQDTKIDIVVGRLMISSCGPVMATSCQPPPVHGDRIDRARDHLEKKSPPLLEEDEIFLEDVRTGRYPRPDGIRRRRRRRIPSGRGYLPARTERRRRKDWDSKKTSGREETPVETSVGLEEDIGTTHRRGPPCGDQIKLACTLAVTRHYLDQRRSRSA